MKSLARGYFWWPGLDAAIVERVQQNTIFVLLWASPLQGHPWKWSAKPWGRIHSDFFENG